MAVFVAGEDFLAVAIGVEVAAVLGVAMSQTGGGESLPVVVDDHGAEDNLVAAVPVHIGDAEIMVALAKP